MRSAAALGTSGDVDPAMCFFMYNIAPFESPDRTSSMKCCRRNSNSRLFWIGNLDSVRGRGIGPTYIQFL